MNLGAENNRFDTIWCKDIDVENGVLGGGGVKQTILYTWDGVTVSTSSTDVKIIYLLEDIDKFDYLVVTASANDTKRHSSVVIDCHSIDWSNFTQYYIDFGSLHFADDNYLLCFYVNLDNNKKKCQFFVASRGSNYTSTHIQSVVGIKYIDPDIKNATSLDETLLYSGNDYINDKTSLREYTLADMADNYDYLLVRSSAVSINGGNVISTYTIISPPFIDNVNQMIPFNFWYESQDAYNSSVQNLYYFSGWFRLDGTKLLQVGLRGLGSGVNNFYVEKVIGIKKNSLSTADIAEMAAPSNIYVTLPTDGTAFNVSAGDFIEVIFTSSSNDSKIYVAVRKDAQSSWVNQYLFDHRVAEWETRQVVLLDGVSEGKLICYGNMSGISSVNYRYSVGHAKALGLL